MTILTENLDHLDLEDMMEPKVTIDEYAAKMGKNKDIVTLAFTVFSNAAAEDLVVWFERGYDFVLDASVSEGELEPGKYLVFVELDRRSKVPDRIIRLLSELDALTGIKVKEWKLGIKDNEYPAIEDSIKDNVILNPNEYKMVEESDEALDEYKTLANIPVESKLIEDEYIKNLKAMAGM